MVCNIVVELELTGNRFAAVARRLREALIAQRPLHVDDEAWSVGTNTLLGPVFASVSDERFVRMGLQNMLVETDHSSFMESRGCAHAFQYCAPRHLGPAIAANGESMGAQQRC